MRVNKIRIQERNPIAAGSVTYELPVCDLALDSSAGNNGYFIKVADGLGPPDLSAVVDGFDDFGVPIYASNAVNRKIALKVQLKPGINQSFSSLRDGLYRYMSRAVTISMMNGSIEVARTYGYISAFDPDMFTNQPSVQVVITCDYGELFAPIKTIIPTSTLNTTSPTINYTTGTAPTGLYLAFAVTANHSNITFTNHAKTWYAGNAGVSTTFTVNYNFLVGDTIVISTDPNDKKVLLTRSSVVYDLAGYINSGAVWPRLVAGVNAFNWTLTSSWMTWTEASYISRYWGV